MKLYLGISLLRFSCPHTSTSPKLVPVHHSTLCENTEITNQYSVHGTNDIFLIKENVIKMARETHFCPLYSSGFLNLFQQRVLIVQLRKKC